MTAIGKPELVVLGDVYRFTWPCGIEADVERLAEHRDELSAEVTVRSSRPPNPGLLHSARLNLMSSQTRKTLVQALAQREPDLDWSAIVEGLCFVSRERYRNGEPAIDLRDELTTPRSRWLVEPFVEDGGGAVLFADGGTGKSLTALAIAATAASGYPVMGRLCGDAKPVLYLDWETNHETMYERLAAIVAGSGMAERPTIFYRRMTASLAEAADNIRRDVTKLGVGLVIVDSLGAARAGEPESADMTIRLFNAARSLGVPWIGVDHVTKAAGNESTRPFGSTYTHNLARLTWSADKAQNDGENSLVIALTNRKRNNGRLLPRLGFRVEFETGQQDELRSVRFIHTDLTQTALADRLPLRERILAELKRTPMAQAPLAEALSADFSQVRARVAELRRGGRLQERDGVLWVSAS